MTSTKPLPLPPICQRRIVDELAPILVPIIKSDFVIDVLIILLESSINQTRCELNLLSVKSELILCTTHDELKVRKVNNKRFLAEKCHSVLGIYIQESCFMNSVL